jgi:hypothetical protein
MNRSWGASIMPSDTPSDTEQAVYSERLWPSAGIWAATIGFGAALGLIPAPISARVAVITAVVGVVASVTLLVISTPMLTVTAKQFAAGRARVPVTVVATIDELDREQMRQARGVRLDARAYLCIRGWLPAGARVVLADPEDPTPYWIVSSRRPEALATALRTAIDRVGRPD